MDKNTSRFADGYSTHKSAKMLIDLTDDQRVLADYMSALSEQAFHAGWMENFEHALWRAVVDGSFRYGRLDITSQHTERLRVLSSTCGGWIVFDSTQEETFISLQKWISIYDPMRALPS